MKNRVKLDDCKCELIIARGNGKTTRFKDLVERSMRPEPVMKIEILDKDFNVLGEYKELFLSIGGSSLRVDEYGLNEIYISFERTGGVIEALADLINEECSIRLSRGDLTHSIKVDGICKFNDEIAFRGKGVLTSVENIVYNK